MRTIKSANSIIYLSIISLGVLLVSGFIFIQTTKSQNLAGKNKIKPLIVLEDQNRPNLNYDGTRVVALPEIGLSEVFDVDTGKKLGSYKIEESDTVLLSPDGMKVRIFYDFYKVKGSFASDRYQITYEVDTGKILSQEKTAIYKNGEHYVTLSVRPNAGMAEIREKIPTLV